MVKMISPQELLKKDYHHHDISHHCIVQTGREGCCHRYGVSYLLAIFVFQTLMAPSEDPDIVLEPSVVMTTAFTAAAWPLITCRH